jgi:hypothetical protein
MNWMAVVRKQAPDLDGMDDLVVAEAEGGAHALAQKRNGQRRDGEGQDVED